MTDLNLDEVEEVEVQRIPVPPVEEIIRQAALNVQRFETPNGTVTILQFITPVKMYSFQLDDQGAERLSDSVRPSKIKPATLLDLPPGART